MGLPRCVWARESTAPAQGAKGVGAINAAPELRAGVLVRGVGAVAEAQPKDLLALLVQVIEGPAAREVCGQGHGPGRGIQKAVP